MGNEITVAKVGLGLICLASEKGEPKEVCVSLHAEKCTPIFQKVLFATTLGKVFISFVCNCATILGDISNVTKGG